MRKLVLLFALLVLLFASPAHATWSLLHASDNTGCNTTSCAVTVPSTGTGHLLVAGILAPGTGDTISSVTVGACISAWTHAPNTAISAAGNGSGDIFYCTNSASGQTSITITVGGAANCGGNCVGIIEEATSTLGNIAIDSGATPSQKASDTTCTSCAGVSLTLSGNNDFIFGLAACGGTCSGVTGSGWMNDLSNPAGDGTAHGITSGSQTAPATWTQTSGTLICSAAAFQETSSGGAAAGAKAKIKKLEMMDPQR